jgi:hypothetical protein
MWIFFSAENFFLSNFWSSNPWIWFRIDKKMLDPYLSGSALKPMRIRPQHCNKLCILIKECGMDEKRGTLTHARSRPVATNLQLGRQSWLMYAAVPSHSCAQFLRQLNMTEKSFLPGTSSSCSSSSESSAMQPEGKEKEWKGLLILLRELSYAAWRKGKVMKGIVEQFSLLDEK